MGGIFGGGTISNETPRINSLRITQSNFGAVIPIIFGTNRVSGNIIDYIDFTALPHTTKQGGKGGPKVSNTTYTYTVAICIALCEGPITKIKKVWQNKNILQFSDMTNVLLKTGEYGQDPWSYMTSKHPERALGYSGVAYVAFSQLDLGDQASLPNFSFEVEGFNKFSSTIVDANPKDVVYQLLTNNLYGANFPKGSVGDLSQFSNYCVANGFFISPAMTEQKETREWIQDICSAMNSEAIWSQGKVKIIPYGDQQITGNGATYTPNNQPLYEITSTDFLDQDEPITMSRTLSADAYNVQTVEFLNRENGYNAEPAEEKDQANIELSGLKTASPINYHFICDSVIAHKVARLQLQKTLYIRNQDTFKVGWKFCLLDVMDIVSLSDLDNALDNTPVRIINIKENEDEELEITVEEIPDGVSSAPVYASQQANRPDVNANVLPGSVNAPIIFEPPPQLTNGNLESWMAVSGVDPNWGGAGVWLSLDGNSYSRVGMVTQNARTGVLASSLPVGIDPDTINTLSVDLTQSRGSLLSGTKQDADTYGTLCYVDGELMAYQTATLTALNKYNLTYLRRGIYGTTIASHAQNSKFARLDSAIFKYPFTQEKIGQVIYIKLTSFNIFGMNEQTLDQATAYQHVLTNKSQGSPNSSFAYNQSTPATTWNITHNLNKYPSVVTIDSTGITVTGTVSYIDQNTLTITFSAAIAGNAYLN